MAASPVIETAKQLEKAIAKADGKGKLRVGSGLYLWVRGEWSSWTYHYREGDSMRSRSFGPYPEVTLQKAKAAREAFSTERRNHRIERRGLAIRARAEPGQEPKRVTPKRVRFAELVESFIVLKASEWKVKSTQPREYRRLKTGKLGKLYADEIDQTAVENELLSRWGDALATADKMRTPARWKASTGDLGIGSLARKCS
jgi:hypothetical protein